MPWHDRVLRVLKFVIALGVVAMVTLVGWAAFQMSPELSLLFLGGAAFFWVIEVVYD